MILLSLHMCVFVVNMDVCMYVLAVCRCYGNAICV